MITLADPQDIAQTLEDAADLLLVSERVCRLPGYAEQCVVTAIYEVANVDIPWMARTTVDFLDRVLVLSGFRRDDDASDIALAAQWNDATEDDFEVIDGLRHVAKDLRNNA